MRGDIAWDNRFRSFNVQLVFLAGAITGFAIPFKSYTIFPALMVISHSSFLSVSIL